MVALAAEAAAKHHFVLTAKEIESTPQEGINRILFALAFVPATIAHHACTGRLIGIAGHIHQFAVEIRISMHAVDVGFPAVVKALSQVGENAGVVFIRICPLWRYGLATIVMGFTPVAVPGWQSAPGRILGVAFPVFIADRKGRAVGHIRIHHAVEEFFTVVVVINKAVVILIARNQAAAYLAGLHQRRLQIQHVALFIPATVAGTDITFEFIAVCMFAHHIDIGRRVSRPGHQAGCAAYHFDTVINRGIGGSIAEVPHFADGGRQVIVRIVTHEESA